MYSPVLSLHSWLRWAVLLLGAIAIFRALAGWMSGRPWTDGDDRIARWFVILLDTQVLVGLLLYFVLSPLTKLALQDFGRAMENSALRFWAVEHVFGMVVGLVLAHMGGLRIRKAPHDARRHRRAAIYFGLALIAILAAIPWPGMPNWRPLFRW